ncbi:hypothetical protein KM472_gp030 [Cynomolgus macaque cytomegalovirus strain Ottawa]|uniref:Protein UL17 n=1 Tax=macacine betaherpesvirus 8 TaxID=2560567 RepID=G8H133_9BETA|nr:hypothetical protein KM472_gp030 [Cynomolgus macaque cytomegalovirus strain Ottawa]AEQ32107.1 hypothetical protein cy30 [Cynomolgus macaque cytomegalovirus strain Ottawa]
MEHALFDHFFGRPRVSVSRHSLLRSENECDDDEEYPPIPRVPQVPPRVSQTTRAAWNIVDVFRLLPLQMRLMVAEEEKMTLTTSPRTHKKKPRKLVEISPRIRRLFT